MKTLLMRGAGDLASGAAIQLYQAGWRILMTELPQPLCVRCQVSFSRAVYLAECQVGDVRAGLVVPPRSGRALTWRDWPASYIGVTTLPYARLLEQLRPQCVVDGIMAKRNLGLTLADAPWVLALGPGFNAGQDCRAVIETQRGPDLGRVIWQGAARADTGVPGLVGGADLDRVLRSPAAGRFQPLCVVGETVRAGQTVARVGDLPVCSRLDGVLRGLLPDGTPVTLGLKCGDVDPRGQRELCFLVSDKAERVGRGVLSALEQLAAGIKLK